MSNEPETESTLPWLAAACIAIMVMVVLKYIGVLEWSFSLFDIPFYILALYAVVKSEAIVIRFGDNNGWELAKLNTSILKTLAKRIIKQGEHQRLMDKTLIEALDKIDELEAKLKREIL